MHEINFINFFSEWEKPKEWLEYERQRSSVVNKVPDRARLQKQVPSNRDRGRNLDLDYDDTDSRGSMGLDRGLGDNRGRDRGLDRGLDRGDRGRLLDPDLDPRLSRDQQDMEISSSHDTTPTSDESHPQRGGHGQLHHGHHHRQESHDYHYDNSQDKTPPLQHQHSQVDNGTPSPMGGHSTPSHEASNNLVNPASVSNLVSNSPLIALKPQIPALTPSLARFCKESLIGHVTNWPAEAVERSCQRINEEHLNISNLGITKVSSELKMARSLVRLAEIQATLQEQRILFLRQQSMDLETMRPRVAFLHSINEPIEANNAQHEHNQTSPVTTPTIVTS